MNHFVSVNILQTAIAIATPLFIGALGGLYSERVGIVNIGLDGMMLMGAFTAAVVSYYSGSAWLGVGGALVMGMLLGLLHATICIRFKANQTVSGVAINILAGSVTVFLLQVLFHNKGQSPSAPQIGSIGVSALRIPVIGPLLQNMSYLTLVGLALVVASYVFLYHTKLGLRLRSVGENPYAAQSVGIPVVRYMYWGVMLGGTLAGLAGSFLSIGMLNVFTRNMTAGRGYIALATLIFGRWSPFGLLIASLFFGYISAWQISLQGLSIPAQFVEAAPYVFALLVLALVSRRSRGPAFAGRTFTPDDQ